MDIQRRLKILGIIMAVFNLSSLMFIDLSKNITAQLVLYVPIILFVFFVIYSFVKGKNWARICVIIGAVLNLLFFFGLFFKDEGILKKSVEAIETLFSIYLLLYLGKESVVNFFKPVNAGAPVKPRKVLKILITIGIIGMLLIGGCALLIKYMISSMNRMEISLENVQSAESKRLTQDGFNLNPSFSRDGTKIIFVHGKNIQNKRCSEIKMMSLEDGSIKTVLSGEGYYGSPFFSPD